MSTLRDVYYILLAILVFCIFCVASSGDYRDAVKSEEHVQWVTEKRMEDDELINRPAFAGKPSFEAQYVELQDRWEEIKSKK